MATHNIDGDQLEAYANSLRRVGGGPLGKRRGREWEQQEIDMAEAQPETKPTDEEFSRAYAIHFRLQGKKAQLENQLKMVKLELEMSESRLGNLGMRQLHHHPYDVSQETLFGGQG